MSDATNEGRGLRGSCLWNYNISSIIIPDQILYCHFRLLWSLLCSLQQHFHLKMKMSGLRTCVCGSLAGNITQGAAEDLHTQECYWQGDIQDGKIRCRDCAWGDERDTQGCKMRIPAAGKRRGKSLILLITDLPSLISSQAWGIFLVHLARWLL